MTTVCAYAAPTGEVWIGSDSLWSGSDYAAPIKGAKIVKAGAWWLGFASDTLVPYRVRRDADAVAQLEDPAAIMAWLLALYREIGIKSVEEPGEVPYYRQQCVLAHAEAGVFDLCSDGQVCEPAWGFVAIGSGSRHAYGAAHALLQSPQRDLITPRDLVYRGIDTACYFDLHSGGPIIVERVG